MMSSCLLQLPVNVKMHAYPPALSIAAHEQCPSLRSWRLRCLVAFLACVLLGGCTKPITLSEDVQRLTFKTLSGDQIELDDIKGPVLINFWATDCAICIHEMPDMVALYERYKSKGFELIAVAMPYDAPNNVLEMAEREQWPFPVALDINGEALGAFATVKGTPTSYLLDKDGQLIKRYVGAIPINKLQTQLNSLLGVS